MVRGKVEEPYSYRETLSLPSPLSQAPRLTIPPSDIIPNVFDPPLALLPLLPGFHVDTASASRASRCAPRPAGARVAITLPSTTWHARWPSRSCCAAARTPLEPSSLPRCLVCVCLCIYEGAHYRAIRRNFLIYEYFYLYVFCLYCLL